MSVVSKHSFGSWTTTKAATCISNGTKTRSCTACGYTETQSIAALGHNYVDGKCTRCGDAVIIIYSQPTSVTVKSGDTATFSVTVKGRGLSYQWWIYKPNVGVFERITSEEGKTDTLTVKTNDSSDGLRFRCVVTDADGHSVTSNVATLTVIPVTKITSQPSSVYTTADKTATFSVAATGSGLKYQWQYSTNGGKTWSKSSQSDATTNTLTVEAKSYRDSYKYRCVVTDSKGNKVTSNAATLSVTAITTQPASCTKAENSKAVFTVKATGSGLKYQWQYSTDGGKTWSKSSQSDAVTNTLTVEAKSYRDGYKYRCVVTDNAGNKLTSNAAKLTITASLAITTQPTSANTAAGNNAKFTVKATGSGLKYQWQYSTDGGKTWSKSSQSDATTNTLTVEAKSYRDGYKYRCVVTDTAGNKLTSNAAKLTVTASLAITTQPTSCTKAENSKAVFTVKATGSGLTYQWQYSTDGGKTWSKSSQSDAATNTLTIAAKSYRNGYMYRCIVMDVNAKTVISNSAKLTVK